MYRLVDGAYEVVEPLEKTCASEPDTVWSDVFDTHIRFLPDAREDAEEFCHLPTGHRQSPRFQWYDPEEGRWRDTETDAEQERDQAAQERTDMAIDMMREFLGSELEPEHLDRIEEVWRGDGPPTDAARRVRTVLQSPHTWRSLLGGLFDDDHGSDCTPTPPGGPAIVQEQPLTRQGSGVSTLELGIPHGRLSYRLRDLHGAYGLKQSWKNGSLGSGLPETGRACAIPRCALHYAV